MIEFLVDDEVKMLIFTMNQFLNFLMTECIVCRRISAHCQNHRWFEWEIQLLAVHIFSRRMNWKKIYCRKITCGFKVFPSLDSSVLCDVFLVLHFEILRANHMEDRLKFRCSYQASNSYLYLWLLSLHDHDWEVLLQKCSCKSNSFFHWTVLKPVFCVLV